MKGCPFCGGRVGKRRGIGGIPFFECTNKECACVVSFKGTEKSVKAAEGRWNRRED